MTHAGLHRLIYVSAARTDMTPDELESILLKARENNTREDVTGLLLFHDGSFFQVLEGPYDGVQRIFAAIGRDERHSRVLVLQTKDADRRAFPSWSMGYVNAHSLKPQQKAHLIDLSRLVGTGEQADFTPLPAVAIQINAFLGSFREFEPV